MSATSSMNSFGGSSGGGGGGGTTCPKCGSTNCHVINEAKVHGKDFSASKGCCGAILLGPIGVLCGACGKGKQIDNVNYWVCNSCGNKWRV